MRFPKEKIIFAVDFIPVKGVAFRDFPDAYLDEWIELAAQGRGAGVRHPGAGPRRARQQGRRHGLPAIYLEDLRAQVLAAARAGKTLEETKKRSTSPSTRTGAGYEQMSQLNIEGVYRLVQATRRPN